MIISQVESDNSYNDEDFEEWYKNGGRMKVEEVQENVQPNQANQKSQPKKHIVFCSWCGQEYFISRIFTEENRINKCEHCGFNSILTTT